MITLHFFENSEVARTYRKENGTGGDTCFGCHGGRSWYRIAYPYPRNAWPGMPTDMPDWARDRPTQSEARFLKTEQAK